MHAPNRRETRMKVFKSDEQKRKKKILIVDDEADIRHIFEKKIYGFGYNVDTAATGMQAIQKLKANQDYDLVISDLKMPKIDGIQLYKLLHDIAPEAKFLMITGTAVKDKLFDAFKVGVVNVMVKPVAHQKLQEKIVELIGEPSDD